MVVIQQISFLSGPMGKVSLWSCKGIIVSLEQPADLYVMEPENGVKVRVAASLCQVQKTSWHVLCYLTPLLPFS